ncbi:MAG: universal stress protein UspA [Chloroflexi bacterium]|nr:MAG: universal stress protein UspA [Chloroflexota bacterium]
MVADPETLRHQVAVRDFKRARREASMQQLMARITGESADLLAYNEVCARLKVSDSVDLGVQEIALDAIVGSVGRYKDFTRSFMPKNDQAETRWVGVKTAVNDMVGMPPIDVYKVGDAYFVNDGNHRVSVARQLGSKTIAAYVTEVVSRVPLTDHADPDELICKERYLEFLEKTNLDTLRDGANLSMTFAGHYRNLREQIEAHQASMAERQGAPVPDVQAVTAWYDDVYLPVIRIIREQGILHNFPERTEADMYVLLSERRAQLEDALGWSLDTETAVTDLVKRSQTWRGAGVGVRLRGAMTPLSLEDGPQTGEWRRRMLAVRHYDRLFAKILVPIRGIPEDWLMVQAALAVARREQGRLMGLHIVTETAQKEGVVASQIKHVFDKRCENAGVQGELVVTTGKVARTITERAAWAVLVMVNLMYPPAKTPLRRLGSGCNMLIQRSPRPVFVLPGRRGSNMKHALLAYDGSPKASEALFVAAYLAVRWCVSLTILTVETRYTSAESMLLAQEYLAKYNIAANFVLREGYIGKAVLETVALHHCDLVIMGGVGFRPVPHLVLGSTVDLMLRECKQPILICR